MIDSLTTKLELDVMQATDLDQAVQLAAIHSLPAVIVHPQLATAVLSLRVRRRGQFKLMTTIDWPKGDVYGSTKLRGMSEDMLQMDGYEIMLSGGRTSNETKNEASYLCEFIKTHIGKMVEVRFVLGASMRTKEDVLGMCSIMKDVIAPNFLRTDHHTRMQATKANLTTHKALYESIKAVTGRPVKISGNIDDAVTARDAVAAGVARCAVNIQQLQAIVKDLMQEQETRQLALVQAQKPE